MCGFGTCAKLQPGAGARRALHEATATRGAGRRGRITRMRSTAAQQIPRAAGVWASCALEPGRRLKTDAACRATGRIVGDQGSPGRSAPLAGERQRSRSPGLVTSGVVQPLVA